MNYEALHVVDGVMLPEVKVDKKKMRRLLSRSSIEWKMYERRCESVGVAGFVKVYER